MTSRDFGRYAVALAILVVGALWAGVPAGTLALAGVVLVCPLMMIILMRGMRGGQDHDYDAAGTHDHTSRR